MITNHPKINLITNTIYNTYAISCCRYGATDIHISDNRTEIGGTGSLQLFRCRALHNFAIPFPGGWPCGKTEQDNN